MTDLIDSIIDELLRKINIKKAVVVGCKKSEFENSFYIENDLKREYDCVIVREMSNTMLGRLAVGAGNGKEKIVLTALLEGKKVYIVNDNIEFLNYGRKNPLYVYYSSCLERLEYYGAERVGDIKIIDYDYVKSQYEFGIKKIICTKRSVITPLAADFTQKNKIEIVRR